MFVRDGDSMNCPFCGVQHNDTIVQAFSIVAYFFECGNAYDAREEYWIDICVSQPKFP